MTLNKSKRIGFVAHGPGSANSVHPIMKALKKEYEIVSYAYHDYVAKLWGTDKLETLRYPESFETLDLILYGTGSSNLIELEVPKEAKKYGIPTISVLDSFWSDKNDLSNRFRFPPTYLIVPNEKVRTDFLTLGIMSENNVYPLGNPHFDRLKDVATLERDVFPPLKVVFYSQCSATSDFSDTGESSKQALTDLVKYRDEYPHLIEEIIVTPHPREHLGWLKHFCEQNKLVLESYNRSSELLLTTDISVGVSCTLQYEALIIGKPTIFYMGRNDLHDRLSNIVKNGTYLQETPITDFNATNKIVTYIKDIMT